MASMPDNLELHLKFTPAPLLTLRMKLAGLIVRFGCWIGGGYIGEINVEVRP